jgi:hypothetical protein
VVYKIIQHLLNIAIHKFIVCGNLSYTPDLAKPRLSQRSHIQLPLVLDDYQSVHKSGFWKGMHTKMYSDFQEGKQYEVKLVSRL